MNTARLPFRLRNPLTMVGRLARTWLLTYRTPVGAARALLPAGLDPVQHGGHAYWNVVVCRVEQMRPAGAPAALGLSYWHVAYRLYARVVTATGAIIEGLYFLRSDCDSSLIRLGGNLLTDFALNDATVRVRAPSSQVQIVVSSPAAPAVIELDSDAPVALLPGSPFASVEAAAAALKYRPFGISLDHRGRRANIVRIQRDEAAWRARPVRLARADLRYLADQPVTFELAVEVEPIEYRWQRGRIVALRR